MINVLTLFFLLLIGSCSSIKTLDSSKGQENNQLAQVDMGELGSLPGSQNQNPTVMPPIDTIRIGENGGNVYTQNDNVAQANDDQLKKMRISLSFGPGLYRSLNYVSVLKILEKHKLAPKTITGTEFGAVVAAMYAIGMTPEVIEWNFYKYFKEKKNYRLYSDEWLEELDKLLLEKFKNKKIQETSKKFFITLYNSKTKKTYFFDKGNIRELLLSNFRLTGSEKNSQTTAYSTAMESEVFNPRLMKKVGSDFVIGVDSLGMKFDLEDSNEFLIGIYGKASGQILKEKKAFDFFITLPLSKMSLDSTENVAFFMMNSQQAVESQMASLKKTMQLKISPSLEVLEN